MTSLEEEQLSEGRCWVCGRAAEGEGIWNAVHALAQSVEQTCRRHRPARLT